MTTLPKHAATPVYIDGATYRDATMTRPELRRAWREAMDSARQWHAESRRLERRRRIASKCAFVTSGMGGRANVDSHKRIAR